MLVAYRDHGFVEENVRKLLDMGFEVIIAADEPNERLKEIIRKYELKATLSEKRRGKWKALNDALELVSGDYVLFLDSDTKLVEIGCYERYDALEVEKVVNSTTLVEKLVGIDYLNMLLATKLASRLEACLTVNGAAFIVKREVLEKLGGFRRRINEDTDLGVRLSLSGYKIGVGGRAITKAPSNFKDWLAQRERWSIGGAEVFIEHIGKILRKPKVLIPYLFLSYPAAVGIAVSLALPDSLILKALYFLLPLLLFVPHKFLSFVMLAIFEIHVIKNLIAILTSFLIWAGIILTFSKKVDYRIEYKLLPIYFFFYSPLWVMLCITAFFKVLFYRATGKKLKVKNWVV